MEFLFIGLCISLLSSIPLFVRGKIVFGFVWVVGLAGFLGLFFYSNTPLTIWPLFGWYGYSFIILFFIATFVASFNGNDYGGELSFHPIMIVAAVFLLIGFIVPMEGWGLFNHSKYASLLGKVEERNWTQDIQPKDPKHIRMACTENASFVARQAFGQAGAIGSQFEVDDKLITPQLINKQFRLIVPIDFVGFSSWLSAEKVPGYIVVNGEDPTISGTFVKLPEKKQFNYSPNAFFGNNLNRHIWRKGYYNYGQTSCKLEVDEDNKEWWVVTLFKPAVAFWGKKFEGVLLVDPVSGDCIFHKAGDIPLWVDLAVPESFVEEWVDFRGKYHLGWLNSWLWEKGITCGERPVMVYGNDGEPYWVTGQTSNNEKDTSILGLYYTDTRTAKTVFYKVDGGSTDEAILNAVAKNEQVVYKKLHGVVPQIYNILGTMGSVVPLLNESNMFQGVAVVNVKNIQTMGVGKDQFEAFRNYEKLLSLSGHQVVPDFSRKIDQITGTVKRITLVPQSNTSLFYILLDGVPHSFIAAIQLSPELVFTREKEKVVISYYSSGQTIETIDSFDNLEIVLESTKEEKEVLSQSSKERNAVRKTMEAKTAKAALEGLSEDELIKLRDQIDEKK